MQGCLRIKFLFRLSIQMLTRFVHNLIKLDS
ncbi:hypothetical protein EXE10_16720 [Acinetobacter sp. WCHAc060033]|nr:hypothetical protein EXE10_16720 [Acinetobacter sp. WCHAc060033]